MTKPHKHCPVCGISIPPEERFCSPKCEETYAERARKVAKTRRMFYIILAVIIVIYIAYVFRGQLGF
ncbi:MULTISPECIES: DUF2116 family Zn-ribbon domain-containing protein [Methanobacterium]|jgi:predicted nucleic acid-binding Zn ribbon protein|uniref:DUF2116 family Zn-ribbon domain-containing protein n=1 Tax=Methanobacterium veterum TaxID=408577 RepID=A0A9E5DPP1_9EURY|nr:MULTISPECIES: DUF2116 family Zn-ribbon domain-containing protein [Methanobacterium]MCZ3366694.1 DUF2116 family Zn-ribbon domain-containing protein [Methanobacterium veterum]MCZ3374161.1 DUF2116 family Zn-ribbon domain-containing protein [Methanobacterium veterum]